MSCTVQESNLQPSD